MKRKIAVLFHENDRRRPLVDYQVCRFAEYWREDGLEVEFLYGVKRFVPADLVFIHVDLSVVPDEYLEFARRYPVAVNGRVKDIRKSAFSENLVLRGDDYEGKVIVKTNLNFAGRPERINARSASVSDKLIQWVFSERRRGSGAARSFRLPHDYRIYDGPGDVPPAFFDCPDLVVEKFLPEIENGFYCVRLFQFLGDRMDCIRMMSDHPIVNSESRVEREWIEPHGEVVELRKKLGFDYGKFDYAVHEGRIVLFDTNKTPGLGMNRNSPGREARQRNRAAGIYFHLDGGGLHG